jgi:hypothetical protein
LRRGEHNPPRRASLDEIAIRVEFGAGDDANLGRVFGQPRRQAFFGQLRVFDG